MCQGVHQAAVVPGAQTLAAQCPVVPVVPLVRVVR